jgi:hypothetical protein
VCSLFGDPVYAHACPYVFAAPAGGAGSSSGAAPAAAGGDGGGHLVTEDRLRAILREEREVEEVSISKASPRLMASLLDDVGVAEAETQPAPVLPPGFLPSFAPFDWAGGEDARSSAAAAQLSAYLTEAGVNMAVAGPGFKVADVHRLSLLTTQLGRLLLKGGTDAIVIPASQDPDYATQQARVVVDFKAVSCDYRTVMGQAQAELIAASSLSRHDVLVIFTDLSTFGHALRSDGGKLLVWKQLTPQQVIWVAADFLRNYCAPVGVSGVDDERIPGEPAAKRRRFSLVLKAHELVPRNTALLEQLEVFNTGHWEDYLEGRDLVLNYFAGQQHFSYFV